jgi:uncharacterized membrane protein YheB (UPF0754 family)
VIVGYLIQNHILLTIGLFALSGSLTNSIAIHMLFEKVPLFYGSGVIENRFDAFKLSIHSLIMEQFFTKETITKFFNDELSSNDKSFDLESLLDRTDFLPAFVSLKSVVMESSFGSMLSMFGGEVALDPLKEPFIVKIKTSMKSIVATDYFQNSLKKILSTDKISDDINNKINTIVNARLEELTPKMVKGIIQDLIKEHLGWLVVWGGVFGGLIGLVSSFFL